MHASHKIWKRAGAACAATALVLGTAFTALPAAATTADESTGAGGSAEHKSGGTPEPAHSTREAGEDAALPDPEGLEEAVERDLGKTLEEFIAAGDLVEVAEKLKAALADQQLTAEIVVVGEGLLALAEPEQLEPVEAALAEATEGLDLDIEVKSSDQAAKEQEADEEQDDSGAAAAPAQEPREPATGEAPEESAGTVTVDSIEALISDYTAEFGLTNLQSVTTDGSTYTIRTGDLVQPSGDGEPAKKQSAESDDSEEPSLEAFVSRYTNVGTETVSGPVRTFAADDLVGGMVFGADYDGNGLAELCSTGFNAFNAEGDEAVLTAGHCTYDGANTVPQHLMDQQGAPGVVPVDGPELGTFGFSQFGGPGHTPSSTPEPDNVGTDIAVIDGINPDLNPRPMVSDWSTAPDMTESGPSVTDVAEPVIGADICKSGRTTGWTCGTIDGLGVFFVGGINYPADPDNVQEGEDPEDVRAIRGFESAGLETDVGDSGGAIVSGTVAVGLISGGSDATTYGTGLVDALSYTDGYTVRLHLETPQITSVDNGGQVGAGASITGVVEGAAAGSEVVVDSEGQSPAAYPVADDGSFSFPAPEEEGSYDFSVEARNGYSTSELATHSVTVSAAPATATPTETAPASPSPSPSPSESAPASPSPTTEAPGSSSPEPTAEPTPEPTAEPTPEPTAEPTPEPTPEQTLKPAGSPTPTLEPTTATPEPETTEDQELSAARLPDTGASNGLKAAASLGFSLAVFGALMLLVRRPARRH